MITSANSNNDDFEKGRCWAQYVFLEDELLEFMRFVPYTEMNRVTYSPKLAGILLQTCGYIDSIFRMMNEFKAFKESEDFQERIKVIKLKKKENRKEKKKKRLSIGDWLEIFEKLYGLSSNDGATLTGKLKWHGLEEMQPFKYPCSQGCIIPDWWHTYNRVKHTWSASTIIEANLVCVLQALAGAFLLNIVHYPSIRFLWKERILQIGEFYQKGSRWFELKCSEEEFNRSLDEAIRNLQPFNETYRIETELFLSTHPKKTKEKLLAQEEASKS